MKDQYTATLIRKIANYARVLRDRAGEELDSVTSM